MNTKRAARRALQVLRAVACLYLFALAVEDDVSTASRVVAAVFLVGLEVTRYLADIKDRLETNTVRWVDQHEEVIQALERREEASAPGVEEVQTVTPSTPRA